MHTYNTEVGAELSSIKIEPGFVEVSLTIKGTSKVLRTSEPLAISDVAALNLSPGERVRLLYTDSNVWTLRRYSGRVGIEKYLHPGE